MIAWILSFQWNATVGSLSIPFWLNEAGNGALLFMLVFMSSYFAFFIVRQLRAWIVEERPLGISFTTYTRKAAIGLFTMAVGFALKTSAAWWSLHLLNHGYKGSAAMTPLFVIGTGLALWGVVCSVRAISPWEWRRWTWAAIGTAAVIFGAVTALL